MTTGRPDAPGDFAAAFAFLEDAPDGFIACDSDFRILFLNAAAARLAGKSKNLVLGLTPWDPAAGLTGRELETPIRGAFAQRAPASLFCPLHSVEVRVAPAPWGGISFWLHPVPVAAPPGAGPEFDDAPVALTLLDTNLRQMRANRRMSLLDGVPAEEHVGRSLGETLPALAGLLLPICRRVLDTGVALNEVELRGIAPAQPDTERDWLVTCYPFPSVDRVIGVTLVLRDVSERKTLERDLLQTTAELNEAQRIAGIGSWTWNPDSGAVTWSDQLHRLAGGDAGGSMPPFEELERYYDRESWQRIQAALERSRDRGTPFEIEAEATLPDGRRRWSIIRGEGVFDPSGQTVKVRGTVQDITPRKRAEQELGIAHMELAAIQAHAPMLFLLVDQDLRIRAVNEVAAGFGWPVPHASVRHRQNPIGCLNALQDSLGCVFGPSCIECPIRVSVLDALRNNVSHDNVEAWVPVRVGDTTEDRCLLVFTAPLQFPASHEALVCALDITRRKRAEKALRDTEHWLRESQRVSQVGSYLFDCATGICTTSETFDVLFGVAPDHTKTIESWAAALHPDDREEVTAYLYTQVLGQGHRFDREYRIIRASDGQVRWIHGLGATVPDSAGGPAVLTGTVRDVTERRAVEEALRQAQKLEGLARLAGGIAHDFNNLLTVINGYSGMLLHELKPDDPLRDSIQEIRTAGKRAADLTHQLLVFSRKQPVELQPVDLNCLIAEDLAMLRSLVGEDIALETGLSGSLPAVSADPGQMHQVLLNLVLNARDAMPHGGVITISTSHRDVEGVPHVLLSVADTGCGIAPALRDRIFDPFFTTKADGVGTGLGLASVHGIVNQAGGAISLESEVGRGTTFLISLPCAVAPGAGSATPTLPAAARPGTETVLVVEDQASVRRLTVRMLSRQGYRILEADGGAQALEVAASSSATIHLLLTDVVMPGMTGPQLVERLRPLYPEMRVLYMSGYSEDVIAGRGLPVPAHCYIAKPFTPDALALKIRDVLAGGSQAFEASSPERAQ